MKFTKMHGAGNDFIMVNGFCEKLPANLPALSVKVCNRNFGIGGDGLIILMPAENTEADYRMHIFNSDGSEAEMCGNGIRCAAVFAQEQRICQKLVHKVLTGAGIIIPAITEAPNAETALEGTWVRVDMGYPVLRGSEIPTAINKEVVLEEPVQVLGKSLKFSAVSMGNPHAVIFVDELNDYLVHTVGAVLEKHELFPAKTNVEFVRVIDENHVEMRVWERGCGETLACGTGSCSTVVAAVLTGRTAAKVAVKLLGGTLFIEYKKGDKVYMTGPATTVFYGEYAL
jgi:diaminopimelate epimerase